MRRVLIIVVLSLSSLLGVTAQSSSGEWLSKLNASMGSRYAWNISVATGGESFMGYYMVQGDAYYLTLGVMEVYSDGKLRYEINNSRKEVTEDRVNLKSQDLLTNPTRAFSFVDKEYTITLKSQSASGAVLKLVPRDVSLGLSDIELTLQKSGGAVLPTKIVYNYDGDTIAIQLTPLSVADKSLPRWSKESYRAYDIVSFL
jgi:hypothetical protein